MSEIEPQIESPASTDAEVNGDTEPTGRRWRLRGKLSIGIAAIVVFAAIAGVVVYQSGDDGPQPSELLATALDLLDQSNNLEAQFEAVEIAEKLRDMGYQDPDFAGGVEFVLGIASFRNAEGLTGSQQERLYLKGATELRKSERLALDKTRRPEWAFALGSSLYEIGKATEARPLLEEAVETFEPGRIVASTRLVDIYLDLKTELELLKAIPLLKTVTEAQGLDLAQRDGAFLRSAQVFLALNRQSEAEAALKQVSNDTQGNHGTIVFRAQTLMAEAESTMAEAELQSEQARSLAARAQQAVKDNKTKEAARWNSHADTVADKALMKRKNAEAKYELAMQQLEPVANDIGLDQTFARQASFLLGLCAEAVGDIDAAINHFERTAEKYAESQEGVAANLRAANLLRRAGRNEEALNKRYRNALKSVKNPQDFRNRWLSLEQFRDQIQTAWKAWADTHAYREALTLASMMTPLFPTVQAREMTARANHRWAEYLQRQMELSAYSERKALQRAYRERWRFSGKSHAALADELKAEAEYPNALRISAEHYYRGHDFEHSLRQWNLYIDTRPKARLAEALVNRAKVLMDLDRLSEAVLEFQLVTQNFPTDAAAFEAQYMLGVCQLERNELEAAEKTWRGIITSESLTPAAKQWQLALLSLGKLMYHVAAMKKAAADSPRTEQSPKEKESQRKEAFQRWDEAIRHLELFLAFVARDARHAEAVQAKSEARYLLANALRHAAGQPQKKLETAETENARLELRRIMQGLLGQASEQYRKLQSDLLILEETDMLSELERQLLRDCFFELAHTYYSLAEFGLDSTADSYNKAILAYSGAANKYPQDPQVILAYIQISKCYDHLGEDSDARSSLEQARVILRQMPDDLFTKKSTSLTKKEWQKWLDWMQSLQQELKVTKTPTP